VLGRRSAMVEVGGFSGEEAGTPAVKLERSRGELEEGGLTVVVVMAAAAAVLLGSLRGDRSSLCFSVVADRDGVRRAGVEVGRAEGGAGESRTCASCSSA